MLQRTTLAGLALLLLFETIQTAPSFGEEGPLRNDPVGDASDPSGPDANSLRLTSSDGQLRIEIGLESTIGLTGTAGTSPWVGFVDLDTDGDRNTGQLPAASYLTGAENLLGAELLLPLDSFSGSSVEVLSADDRTVLATVPARLESEAFVAELPSSLLTRSAEAVRATAVLGTPRGITDVVPNDGYVTSAVADAATRLRGGRFAVEVEWVDYAGKSGIGTVAHAAEDSVLFWFFEASNWELLLKILDGCGVNEHYWVYTAATTDVEYRVSVTDTATGTVRAYSNALGQRQPFVGDTQAFATCP
ncbi:MAG: hypothetical protein AAGK22_02065 [Acidobacteriota bacterium]